MVNVFHLVRDFHQSAAQTFVLTSFRFERFLQFVQFSLQFGRQRITIFATTITTSTIIVVIVVIINNIISRRSRRRLYALIFPLSDRRRRRRRHVVFVPENVIHQFRGRRR